jgi:hypothetical protein
VDADAFDEADFFRAIAGSGARVLLIGRRALIALGLPLLTADYDLWVHIDDIESLNRALETLEFVASLPPEGARQAGRYVLENSEHVDVLVARAAPTRDGVRVAFDDVWQRRQELVYDPSIKLAIPCIDDLLLTKRWAMRDKDIADIRMLELLKHDREGKTRKG